MTELCCYMTLCGMESGHKFLAYKNAMNNNYKMNNFITAAHFARLVLDLETTGVSTLSLMILAFLIEARGRSLVQEVLLGIPAERYQCPKVKLRDISECGPLRDNWVHMLWVANTSGRCTGCEYSEMSSGLDSLCEEVCGVFVSDLHAC